MIKVAIFCPRLPREAETAWKHRAAVCQRYLREVRHMDALEFDTLEDLQNNFRRHTFRRVLVAQGGYYPLEFWSWSKWQNVPVLDVMTRAEAWATTPAVSPKTQYRMAAMSRGETRYARSSS